MTQHAYPCVCTINVKTGQIIDYDCGRVIGQWHQNRPTDCSCPYSQAEDFNCPVHGLPAYRKQPDTPYDAIADTLTPETVDMVNHPPHYAAPEGIDFTCIDITRWMTFDVGNAVKYMWRTDAKNGREDVEKAVWYIRDAIDAGMPVWAVPDHNTARHRLARLAGVQTDMERGRFFMAVAHHGLDSALASLQTILDRP